MRKIQIIAVVLSVFISGICWADNITVGKGGWEDFDNIQEAINYSWDGDVIEVQPGTYEENIYFNNRAIVLSSTDPNDQSVVEATIISAISGYSVTFDSLEGPDSVITGFTITGGGIACSAASPTITHNIIRDCTGASGIKGFLAAHPVIEYNRIINNTGGITDCHGPIRHNTISGNSGVTNGGGLYLCSGEITDNIISDNSCLSSGGGLDECTGNIKNNVITNNAAITAGSNYAYGGGLSNCGAITGNIISGNRVESPYGQAFGGGIYNCNEEISDNKIMNNVAQGRSSSFGGGLSHCEGEITRNVISGNHVESIHNSALGGGLYRCKGSIRNNTISNNTIKGQVLKRGAGGGLARCNGEIINNKIFNNTIDGFEDAFGGGIYSCSSIILNNLISGNRVKTQIGEASGGGVWSGDTLLNNSIIGNIAQTYGGGFYSCTTAKNNIIAFNEAFEGGGIYGSCQNSYNIFWGNIGGNFHDGAYGGIGDIYADPLFARNGFWDPNNTPTNFNDDFWVEGDYHLKSEAGRWDPNMNMWVMDSVTSPAIDTGGPADRVGDEPQPHGDRINMGAYGGTVEAGKTPGTSLTSPGTVDNFQCQGGYEQVELTWEEPADTGGLTITAYKIYRGLASDNLSEYIQVTGAIFSFIDQDVLKDTEYYYAVSAVNDVGEGLQTSPANITASWLISDLNQDGIVNLLDWVIFYREWLLKSPWHNTLTALAQKINVDDAASSYEIEHDVPDIIYVDQNAQGLNQGTDWINAFTQLTSAIVLASGHPNVNEIRVAKGVYRPAGPNGDRNATFQLLNGVTISGGYPTGGGAAPLLSVLVSQVGIGAGL